MSNILKGGGRLGKPILIHQRRDKPASGYWLRRAAKVKTARKQWEYPVLVADEIKNIAPVTTI